MSALVDELANTATSAGAPPRPSSARLAQLGRYRLEGELGAGAMGIVYAAHEPELDRRVALKVLKAVSDDARVRLLREARAMAKLSHPNVVTVFEVGTIDGRDYVAMELVDGMSLADWLKAGEHSFAERLDAMLAAGRGLAAAHAAGIVHRDFKPHNVLRAHDGRVLVTDFGLARSYEDVEGGVAGAAGSSSNPLGSMTRTGTLVGTPAYMAPEQWNGGTITPATDQFAFCVSLWEAIAGTRPFTGATLDELRSAIERGPAVLDTSALPRSMRRILCRGLARHPGQRWPSMTDLLAATVGSRKRRRTGAIAAVLVVTAIALAAFVGTCESPREPQPLTMQFTKIAGGHVTAPQAAIDGLITALRAKGGARYVPTTGAQNGFKLYAIRNGSFLDAIGLQNGDLLIAIDGQPVDSTAHLQQVLDRLTSKPKLQLDVQRAGARVSLTIEAR